MKTDIINDKRPILSLWWSMGEGDDGFCCKEGSGLKNCDSIEPYCEDGQMAPVVWFRIFRNGEVIARINAAHVRQVGYS